MIGDQLELRTREREKRQNILQKLREMVAGRTMMSKCTAEYKHAMLS